MPKGENMQLLILMLVLLAWPNDFGKVKPLIKKLGGQNAAHMVDEIEGFASIATILTPQPPEPDPLDPVLSLIDGDMQLALTAALAP